MKERILVSYAFLTSLLLINKLLPSYYINGPYHVRAHFEQVGEELEHPL